MNKTSVPDDIIDALGRAVFGGPQNLQQQLAAAESSLLMIQLAREDGDLDTKAANAPSAFRWLLGIFDAGETAEKLAALSRDEVDTLVSRFLAHAPKTGDDALRIAASTRQSILAMDEKDHLSWAKALDAALPPGLRAAVQEARHGKSIAAEVREIRQVAATISDAALAAALTRRNDELSAEKLAAGCRELLAQCTPERLQKLHDHFENKFDPAILKPLLRQGWILFEELLVAAAKGNFLRPEPPGEARSFARALDTVYQSLEEGFAAAEIKMPAVFRDLAASADTGRLLRAAQEGAIIDAAQNGISAGITVTGPLRLRARMPKP